MKNYEHPILRMAALSAICLVAGLGCASSQPSRELLAARSAYDTAEDGDASRLAPDRVYEARKALISAEREHDENPGDIREQNLAYIALRLSEGAVAQARLVRAQQELNAQNARFEDVRRVAAERELSTTKEQLSQEMFESTELQKNLSETEKKLAVEKGARAIAEADKAQLQAALNELSKLRTSDRGVTVSLSGSVLFATGQSALLPTAQRVLDEVAVALIEQAPERTIVIEGHTDAMGSDEANQLLSQARAEAVRSYLVGRGVHPARIKAVGRGETMPIASNDKAETRAQNRRVEIKISERRAREIE